MVCIYLHNILNGSTRMLSDTHSFLTTNHFSFYFLLFLVLQLQKCISFDMIVCAFGFGRLWFTILKFCLRFSSISIDKTKRNKLKFLKINRSKWQHDKTKWFIVVKWFTLLYYAESQIEFQENSISWFFDKKSMFYGSL